MLSTKTVFNVAGKAAEGFCNPVILPDNDGGGDCISGAFSTIRGKSYALDTLILLLCTPHPINYQAVLMIII